MTPTVPEEFKLHATEKALWLAALESGQFRQAHKKLFDGTGYCCLGVYAKAKGAEFRREVVEEKGELVESDVYQCLLNDSDINDGELLDTAFAANSAGLTTSHQAFFSNLNDGSQAWSLREDNPLFPLALSLADGSTRSSNVPFMHTLSVRPHTFAEIIAIIKEHF